jgi:DNA-binding MarR family transcriptional regulator
MSTRNELAAHRVVEVIPLVMRRLAMEMRSTGYVPAPVHCRLMVVLAEKPHNLSELAEKQAVSLPTMSNSISTLAERGWVTRARVPHDRRVVMVELTPSGRRVLEATMRSAEAGVRQLLASLSQEECDQLVAGLDILCGCFARASSTGDKPA